MPTAQDHRHGHRGRLRARLLKVGREAFSDYQLLELLLIYAIPRKDTKALAKRLVERFGSFAAVLDQPRERLLEVEEVGPQTVTFILAIRSAMVRYFEQGVEHAETICNQNGELHLRPAIQAELNSVAVRCRNSSGG